MEHLFQETAEGLREQLLRDNCYEVEDNGTYTRPLTEEEIDEAKNMLVKTSIQIREKEDAFNILKKEHNKEMKILKENQGTCVRKVEFGQATEYGNVFLFDDQEAGKMLSHDKFGRFISARPLAAKERQTSILTIKKAN